MPFSPALKALSQRIQADRRWFDELSVSGRALSCFVDGTFGVGEGDIPTRLLTLYKYTLLLPAVSIGHL